MNIQVKNLIGLAQRAGKLLSGEGTVESAIRRGKVKMLILAEDASANTKKVFINLAGGAHIPIHVFGTKIELGAAIGKSHRSVVAITDINFVRGLKPYLKNDDTHVVMGERKSGVD
jgi:ribosomal protein L7Ae-like RNA K-turn-binding protein